MAKLNEQTITCGSLGLNQSLNQLKGTSCGLHFHLAPHAFTNHHCWRFRGQPKYATLLVANSGYIWTKSCCQLHSMHSTWMSADQSTGSAWSNLKGNNEIFSTSTHSQYLPLYSSRLPKAKGLLELKFRQGPNHIGNTLTCEGLDPLGDDLCHVVEQVPPSPRDWRYILRWECWAMGKVGSVCRVCWKWLWTWMLSRNL